MITQDNYRITIFAVPDDEQENAELGYLNGVYTWDVGGDILADDGISPQLRDADLRDGGGVANEEATSITIMGGKYSEILALRPIVGRRFQFIQIGVGVLHTGAITSVDIQGHQSIINLNIESKVREVTLPYDRSVIGSAAIDGTVSGESGYIQTLDEAAVIVVDDVKNQVAYYQINIKGGTPTNVSEINRIIDEIDARLSSGENVYYTGENGIYRLAVRTASGSSGVFPYRLRDGVDFADLEGEVDKYGAILWSTEVFNEGLVGDVVVDGVTIDDVNDNIVEYKTGYAVQASDGLAWKSLTNEKEYTVTKDFQMKNKALVDAWSTAPLALAFNGGMYAANESGGVPDYNVSNLFGNVEDVTDKSNVTSMQATIKYSQNVLNMGIAGGVCFQMHGYKLKAEQLLVVVEAESYQTEDFLRSVQCYVTTRRHSTGEILGEAIIGSEWQDQNLIPAGDQGYSALPFEYGGANRNELYMPTIDLTTEQTARINITDLLLEIDSTYYYDDVDIYVAVSMRGYTSSPAAFDGVTLDIKQINLVEGYGVGREGLKGSSVQIDNSATNGTIPLAYKDVCKRQNFFGISGSAPSGGWGTEQIEYDGNGLPLEANYIQYTIPEGNLNGVLDSDITTTELKREISRSIPAVSYYDKDGVESLLEIGKFVENFNEINYNEVIGEVSVESYSGDDIKPSLLFEFGQEKLKLHITNVEQETYSSAYVLDALGLSSAQKEFLWSAGHMLYEKHGLTTKQDIEKYPIVDDADGAFRIAKGLYANMGAVEGVYYNRQVVTFDSVKSTKHDQGDDVKINFPMVSGFGVVSRVENGAYQGHNTYIIDMIEAETIATSFDIIEHGTDADDVIETGAQVDNIIEDGL